MAVGETQSPHYGCEKLSEGAHRAGATLAGVHSGSVDIAIKLAVPPICSPRTLVPPTSLGTLPAYSCPFLFTFPFPHL